MYRTLKFLDSDYPISVYLGDIGHPRAANKPDEVQYAVDRLYDWLDFYLMAKGTASTSCGDPAPQLRCDVLAAITRPAGAFTPSDVLRVDSIEALTTVTVKEKLAGDAVLTFDPANLGGLFSDPFVFAGCEELKSDPACVAPPPDVVPGDVAAYTIPASRVAADAGLNGAAFLVAGQPEVRLQASTAAARVQLDVRIFEVKATGGDVLITRGTYTLDSGAPLAPIGTADVRIQTYGNLFEVDATDTLRVEITNVDSPYLMPSRVPSVTRISGVHLDLPLRPSGSQ